MVTNPQGNCASAAKREPAAGCLRQPLNRVLYVDHIEQHGEKLYKQVCERDLEGIVCKPAISPYRTVNGQTTWIKVKNPDYSQAEGRGELFNKRR